MSDSFISSLFALGVGESITYVASTPASRDKVRNRGYSFFHKLAPGEDFQCPKEYRQEQVWEDKGLGFSRGPTDMTECICIPKYY